MVSLDRLLDSRALARAGRLHSQIIAANLRNMIPMLMDYGYSQGEIEGLVNACLVEVIRQLLVDTKT